MKILKNYQYLLLLLTLVLAVSINSLKNPFVLDDQSKIEQNTDIRNLRELPSKLIYPYENYQFLERNDPSRPLVFLTYGLVYSIAGQTPGAYRAVNLGLHFLMAMMVFLIACKFFEWNPNGKWAAFLASVFFVILPIQMGVVIYDYALSDILLSALVLCSFYFHMRSTTPSTSDRALSFLFAVLAFASKQSAGIIPFLLVLYDGIFICWGKGKVLLKRGRLYAPTFALLAAYLLARYLYFGQVGDVEGRGNTQPMLDYASLQPLLILKYLYLTFIPTGLAIDHFIGPMTYSEGLRALALVPYILGLGCLYRYRKSEYLRSPQGKLILFALGFYFISVAPTCSIFPTVDYFVERRVYLANFAVVLGIGLLYLRIGERALFSLGLYAFILFVVSIQRNVKFHDNENVWQEALRIYPKSIRAMNNLGTIYLSKKKYPEAKFLFEQLLQGNAKDSYAMQNLASIYEQDGSPFQDRQMALDYLKQSLEINPNISNAYYNRGRIYQLQNQLREAEDAYRMGLQVNPKHVLTHNNLGLVFFHQKKTAEAKTEWLEALRLDPNCEPCKANLALLDPNARYSKKEVDKEKTIPNQIPISQISSDLITKLYEDALSKTPNDENTRKNYAALCWERKLPCAEKQYKILTKKFPKNPLYRERAKGQ